MPKNYPRKMFRPSSNVCGLKLDRCCRYVYSLWPTKLVNRMLVKMYKGELSFTMNAWTLPNHCAYIALLMHLEYNGTTFSFPLDVIEVKTVYIFAFAFSAMQCLWPQFYESVMLAEAFTEVLKEFKINIKVSSLRIHLVSEQLTLHTVSSFLELLWTMCVSKWHHDWHTTWAHTFIF